MIIEREVTVERKERVPYNTPGNMAPPDMANANRDKVRLALGFREEDGGATREIVFLVFADEARGVDVGDTFAMHIDLNETTDARQAKDALPDSGENTRENA